MHFFDTIDFTSQIILRCRISVWHPVKQLIVIGAAEIWFDVSQSFPLDGTLLVIVFGSGKKFAWYDWGTVASFSVNLSSARSTTGRSTMISSVNFAPLLEPRHIWLLAGILHREWNLAWQRWYEMHHCISSEWHQRETWTVAQEVVFGRI